MPTTTPAPLKVRPTLVRVAPVVVDPGLPSDPALRRVADDVLARLKYALAVTASTDTPPGGGIDRVFADFLASREPDARARGREIARGLLDSSPALRTRHFGRYARVSPTDYRPVGSDGVELLVGRLDVDGGALARELTAFRARLSTTEVGVPHARPPADQDAADDTGKHISLTRDPGLSFKKMRMFITHVHCVEETDEAGADSINIGGTVTDPHGRTSPVREVVISGDFDEGENPQFGLKKCFAAWDLATARQGFPYVYTAVMAMAEKDDGGFWKFLRDLYEQVKEEVEKAVAALAGAALGAALGSTFGPLGTVAGAIVGAIVGWLCDLFAAIFDNEDDVVAVRVVTMTLADCRKSYYDWAKLTSPAGWTTTIPFKGDGGHYRVGVAFKVFTK